MSWFKYIMQKGNSGEESVQFLKINEYDNIVEKCWEDFLEVQKWQKYYQLLEDFRGDIDNMESLRQFLPEKMKHLAGDTEKLCDSLTSIFELASNYDLVAIYTTSACYGCQHDRPGQRDHMECDTGCLHTSELCSFCNSP